MLILVMSFNIFICCDFIEDEYPHICIKAKNYFSRYWLVVKLLINHIFN